MGAQSIQPKGHVTINGFVCGVNSNEPSSGPHYEEHIIITSVVPVDGLNRKWAAPEPKYNPNTTKLKIAFSNGSGSDQPSPTCNPKLECTHFIPIADHPI